MNKDKLDCHSNNPINDVCSNSNHKNVQQERTTHNSLYPLANYELQMNYDLEDPYGTNDWKSTNNHKGQLLIAYDNKIGNKTQHQRLFYTLYIRPSDNGNEYSIYRLFTDQILVTEEYQPVPVPVPEDLIEAIIDKHLYDKKIQIINFNSDHPIVQDDHSNNYNKDGHTHINGKNNSEDESYDELNSSPQLNGMESNKIVDQGYQILLPAGSSKSTSISVKHDRTIDTSTFLQGLFLMYLYVALITILCLQLSLTVYVHKDTTHHLYEGFSAVVHILWSLPVSLKNGIL